MTNHDSNVIRHYVAIRTPMSHKTLADVCRIRQAFQTWSLQPLLFFGIPIAVKDPKILQKCDIGVAVFYRTFRSF